MPLIEELLRQAIRGCGELSGETLRAEESVDAMLARAAALGGIVASRSGEAHRELQRLAAHLAHAEHALHEDSRQARSGLDGLAHRMHHLQGRVGALVHAIQDGLAELATRRADLEAQQEARAAASDAATDAMAERIHELEAAVDAGLQEAGAAIAAFRDEASRSREEWRSRVQSVKVGLDRAEEGTREGTRACVAGIEDGFNREVDALIEELPQGLVIEPHNQAIAGLMQQLTEEAGAELGEALGPVRQAIEDLGRSCDGQQARLQQELGELLKKAETALRRLERMQPSWALAQRLG